VNGSTIAAARGRIFFGCAGRRRCSGDQPNMCAAPCPKLLSKRMCRGYAKIDAIDPERPKACAEAWRADKANNQAKGKTEKA
jgi:hypothetical protein